MFGPCTPMGLSDRAADRSTPVGNEVRHVRPDDAPAAARVRVVEPSEVRAVASLLKRSNEVIESRIVGASMGATMPAGTRIRIRCGDVSEWSNGAVVVFFTGRTLVGHRVVARGTGRAKHYWVTRGDGTILCDAPVHQDVILGVVTACTGGTDWHPVPAYVPAGPVRRLAASATCAILRLLLQIDVGVATRWATGTVRLGHGFRRLRGEKLGTRPTAAGQDDPPGG